MDNSGLFVSERVRGFFLIRKNNLIKVKYITLYIKNNTFYIHIDQTRVSNGTGQCNFSGQRDRQKNFVPGQRDNGTEVPSLSRDKGTTGQAQNLAKGRDGPGQLKSGTGQRDSQNPGRDAGQNGTEQKRTF